MNKSPNLKVAPRDRGPEVGCREVSSFWEYADISNDAPTPSPVEECIVWPLFLQDFLAILLRVVAGGQNSSQASSGTNTAAQTKGSSGRNSRRCRDPDWVGRSGKTSWFSFRLCCGSDPRFVCVGEARPHPPQLIGRTKNGRVIKELIFRRLGQSGVSTPEPVGLLHK